MKTFLIFIAFFLSIKSYAQAYETAAKQAILSDFRTGQILFEKNSTELMHPSSMTKIMTSYLAFEDLRSDKISLTQKFSTSEKAWKMGGSRMFLNYGDRVSLDDLLKGIVVQSGNDACVALAEGLAGDEALFVARMNEMAKKLGMMQTNFTNASGWPDPRNLSTAKDLNKLAVAMIVNFPEYYDYHNIKRFTYGSISQQNRNSLLGKLGIDGIKTGHTEAGGYGVVLSAKNDDRRLVAVINGLPSDKARHHEGERIINYGFIGFGQVKVFEEKQTIGKVKVIYGNKPSVEITTREELSILLDQFEKEIDCKVTYKDLIKAPVVAGEKIGSMSCNIPTIYSDSIEIDVIAKSDVEPANPIQKIWQNLEYLFSQE